MAPGYAHGHGPTGTGPLCALGWSVRLQVQGTLARKEPPYAVPQVPAGEPATGQVLSGVRRAPGTDVCPVWHRATAGRQVLPGVWAAGGDSACYTVAPGDS